MAQIARKVMKFFGENYKRLGIGGIVYQLLGETLMSSDFLASIKEEIKMLGIDMNLMT